jgi:hypothetical protein
MLEIGSRLNRRWNEYRNARFLVVFGGMLLIIRNLSIPLNRSYQVVLGAVLESLEHVPRRIDVRITLTFHIFYSEKPVFSSFWTIVCTIGNLIIP